MKPTPGYYRQLLSSQFPKVRIAFTHTPIIGCMRINPDPILMVLDASEDQHANYYAEGIRSGSMVVIVENAPSGQGYYSPGELYLRSGEPENGYKCFYKGKTMDITAPSSYEAQRKAAKEFKAKKEYEVSVVLCEKGGKQVIHKADQ